MARKGNRPTLFTDSKRILGDLTNSVTAEVIQAGATQAINAGAEVKVMPHYLEVTEVGMAKKGVIDLKPFFAKSDKRKYNKKGEWYLYIPMQMKTRDMSRRLYDDLRSVPMGEYTGTKTVAADYLYDRRRGVSPSVQSINYTPKSKNVTIMQREWGDSTRNSYVLFRTVNAKSPASSWIINRDKVNEDNMSKTMLANINRLMNWKMKNL